MRSALYVTALAWRRLRRRDSGALVTAVGLVAATAVLAGVLAGVTIATDRSTARAIEDIPASARSVRAVWFGIPGDPTERLAVLDQAVADAFSGIDLDGPTPLILFRESTIAGRFVWITGGRRARPPRDPAHGSPAARMHARALRGAPTTRTRSASSAEGLRARGGRHRDAALATALRRLPTLDGCGHGRCHDPTGARGTSEYHRPPPAPLVVAEGRQALADGDRSRPHVPQRMRGCGRSIPVGLGCGM